MKRTNSISRSAVGLVITLALSLGVALGQSRPADSISFQDRLARANTRLTTLPSVQTSIEELIDSSGRTTFSAKRIKEVLPPDKEQVNAEVVGKDGTTRKLFAVKIGDRGYMRSGDGDWQVFDDREFGGPKPGPAPEQSLEVLADDVVEGMPVDVFRVTTGSDLVTTYYFDAKSQLRKKIILTIMKGNDGKKRTTVLYSYPASLDINAPI